MLLHIDTDIGGDTDDLCALAMVLGWPDAEVIAVTTVAEEAGRRAGYARYALDLAGRSDVPVFAGADVTLGCYRERPLYPDEARYWPAPIASRPAPHAAALDALARSIEAGVTVVAIGPYTNLALLERRSPGILRDARLVLMGGSVFPIRDGYPAWGNDYDYNIQVEVESARTVLEASRPTLVPLTVTVETALREADLPALRRGGPLARLLARPAEAFAADERMAARFGRTHAGLPDDLINFQHDAESRMQEAMQVAAVEGPEFKRASDPRITRLGRLLRAWSIDELPQFINVLRGEMSVVGPRPIAEWEAEYQGHGWRRLAVKPGLTGTWQISGRSHMSWETRMALDVEYVRSRSLVGDIWIMLRTPWAILTRRGAV